MVSPTTLCAHGRRPWTRRSSRVLRATPSEHVAVVRQGRRRPRRAHPAHAGALHLGAGHGHAHGRHERAGPAPDAGPLRRAAWSARERLLEYSHAASHSLRASLASAACLAASGALVLCASGAELRAPLSSPAAALASLLWAAALGVSGVSATVDAARQVARFRVDSHVLMAVAGASSLALGMLFEGALLFVLFHLSHGLEARYTASASASVSDLVGSVPRTAMSVTVSGSGHVAWDTQREVEVASLSRGDCFVLKPGDTVPLDGVVIEGASSVGQEIVTGESVPVRKGRGDTIFAGSTVHDGTIAVRATHGLSASTPASIARLAASALQDKAPVESLLERVTQRWSQVVLAVAPLTLALLLAAGVPLLGPGGAVYRTLGLLTASAPCALFVVPLAFVCAVSVLARHGILVRGAAVLDKLQGVRCVGLDKTGTLTQGMTCTGVRLLDAGSAAEPSDAVEVAAALSLRSSHPIAQAVLREHTGRSASGTPGAERDGTARQLATVADFTSTGGAGVSGTIAGERVLFGSAAHVVKALPESTKALLDETLLSSAGQLFSVLVQTPLQSRGAEGCSATAPRPRVTLFTFADVAKTGSAAMIGELRRRRLHTRILTGDNAASARAMAASLGVPALEVHADMQPRDKAGWVAERQSQGTAVLMMGDGLNDAPALAQADVGVAIATSADSLAADVASVILLSGSSGSSSGASSSSAGGVDSVSRLVFLLDVAHATHRVVLQNLVLAFGAMLSALLPTVGGLVPLWLTVAVHEGSTVLVAANSCRLLMMRPPPATAAS